MKIEETIRREGVRDYLERRTLCLTTNLRTLDKPPAPRYNSFIEFDN